MEQTPAPASALWAEHMERLFNPWLVLQSIGFGFLIFALCLLGIYTRPDSVNTAGFWPATAFMLGFIVRYPHLNSVWGWLAAFFGFVWADYITGATLAFNLLLNTGNLLGVATGVLIVRKLNFENASREVISTPGMVLRVQAMMYGTALVSALWGSILCDPLLFNKPIASSGVVWFASELVNLLAFVPILLNMPDIKWPFTIPKINLQQLLPRLMPLVALMGLGVLSIVIGGPGAVVYPVPALLWCAVAYGVFANSILCCLFVTWSIMALNLGVMDGQSHPDERLSLRLAVALVAQAPMMVASIMQVRRDLIKRLRYLAGHDPLTGIANRHAFFESGPEEVERLSREKAPVAVLMLDIDHFKKINDTYGHAGGDKVLTAFAKILKESLRTVDCFGRIGGEEFAVVLSNCTRQEAQQIAERIGETARNTEITLPDGRQVHVTVSIGAIALDVAPPKLDGLLIRADEALYAAKANGRDRVEFAATR